MSTLNFQYQAFGFNLASDIPLPELSKKLLIAKEQKNISVVSGNYENWPSIEVSPHSTQCLQLAANEWRLALEGKSFHASLARWCQSVERGLWHKELEMRRISTLKLLIIFYLLD